MTLGGRTSVLVADSQCLEPEVYAIARRQLGEVDAVFVGMECEGSPLLLANGPYLPPHIHSSDISESRRTKASDAASALSLVTALEPTEAYVYAMGLEPWLSYMFGVPDLTKSHSLSQVDVFLEQCRRYGITADLLSGTAVLVFGDEREVVAMSSRHRDPHHGNIRPPGPGPD